MKWVVLLQQLSYHIISTDSVREIILFYLKFRYAVLLLFYSLLYFGYKKLQKTELRHINNTSKMQQSL